MTPENSKLDPAAVADFLRSHPDFFDAHASVFADMRVPHPHEGRAISLAERQVLTLRERVHVLERRIATLTYNAKDNERIVAGLRDWSLDMLAEQEPSALPGYVTDGLARIFDVPGVALRLWDCAGEDDAEWRAPATDDVRTFAASLGKPYCGTDTGFEAVAWLATRPASLALVPIRAPRGNTFGLLVLGSDDADRFSAEMGTDFLEHIGMIAGAALSRLLGKAA